METECINKILEYFNSKNREDLLSYLTRIEVNGQLIVKDMKVSSLYDTSDYLDLDLLGIYEFEGYTYIIYESYLDDIGVLIERKPMQCLISDFYIEVHCNKLKDKANKWTEEESLDNWYKEYCEIIPKENKINHIGYASPTDIDLVRTISDNIQSNDLSDIIFEFLHDRVKDSKSTSEYFEYFYNIYIASRDKSIFTCGTEESDRLIKYFYNNNFCKIASVYSHNDSEVESHGGMYINIYANKRSEIFIEKDYGHEGSRVCKYILLSHRDIIDYEDLEYYMDETYRDGIFYLDNI